MPRGRQSKKPAKEKGPTSPNVSKSKATKPKEVWEKKVTKIKLVTHIPLQRAIPKSIASTTDGSPYKRDVYERHFKRGRDGELEQKSIREHKKNSFRSDEVSNNNGRSDEAPEENSYSHTGLRLDVDGSYSSSQPSSPSSSSASPCSSSQISFLVDPINDSKIPPIEMWDVCKRISPGKREGKEASDKVPIISEYMKHCA